MANNKFKNLKHLRLALGKSKENIAEMLGIPKELYISLEDKFCENERERTPIMRFAYDTLKQKIDTELDPESLRVLRIQARLSLDKAKELLECEDYYWIECYHESDKAKTMLEDDFPCEEDREKYIRDIENKARIMFKEIIKDIPIMEDIASMKMCAKIVYSLDEDEKNI